MSYLNKKESATVDYKAVDNKFNATNFSGPLELLLDLLDAAQLEIKDVFLSEITDQYLRYMTMLPEIDLEKAIAFAEVASILIERKTKALLPRPVEEIAAAMAPEEDSGDELIRRLQEYKLYKEASEKMRLNEQVGLLFRSPDEEIEEPRLVLKDMTSEGLMRAIQKLFLKLERKKEEKRTRKIVLDPFTVSDRMVYIKDTLEQTPSVYFEDLFKQDRTKAEIVTTFQALLELIKLSEAYVKQDAIFDPILISKEPL